MTCIVGIIDNNKVYMGSDSLCSNNTGECYEAKTPKIYKKSSEKYNIIIGCTGSFKLMNLVKNFTPPSDRLFKNEEEYLTSFFS